MDSIFYPDRTKEEIRRFRQEGERWFKTAVRRRSVDRIFWPDRSEEEVLKLYEEGKVFFEASIRRKK